MNRILDLWTRPPMIGVVHVPALPGAFRYDGQWQSLCERVARDATAYCRGGVDGIVIENFGDAPFYPTAVPATTIAHMTTLAVHLRGMIDVPVGINVLRNDGEAACAIALASGAQFIRVNILCGARLTDQGIIQGIAHDLLRLRRNLGAEHIRILADVDVKHSAPLANRDLHDEVRELLERGGADAVIVTGRMSGGVVDVDQLRRAKEAARGQPVFVGSGVSAASAGMLLDYADGLIVGSSLKREANISNEVDLSQVVSLRRAVDERLAARGLS